MPTIAKTPTRSQRSAHNSRDVRSATEGKPEALETPVAEGTLALVGQAVPAGTSNSRISRNDNSENTGNSRITSSTREG